MRYRPRLCAEEEKKLNERKTMTKIYATYEEFEAREDKSFNGVSPEFAEKYPNWKEDNETNIRCWNCRNCSDCIDCVDCVNCWACQACSTCQGCVRCLDCYKCTDCRGCRGCRDLADWQSLTLKEDTKVPFIENIHQKVYEAASKPGALDMEDWHSCDTTHCRAGWAIHLAGEDGYKLEKATDAATAALLIYGESSMIPVDVEAFYLSDAEALESMKKAAQLEKELNEGKL